MATFKVVELFGLPRAATVSKIMGWLGEDVHIRCGEEGVVMKVNPDGSASGEAFVEVVGETDVENALKMNNKIFGNSYVHVCESSVEEMQQDISMLGESSGSAPGGGGGGENLPAPGGGAENLPAGDNDGSFIKISGFPRTCKQSGVPFRCKEKDIQDFFQKSSAGVPPPAHHNIYIVLGTDGDKCGVPTGDAYVKFTNKDDAQRSLQCTGKIGGRKVWVTSSSSAEFMTYRIQQSSSIVQSQLNMSQRGSMGGGRAVRGRGMDRPGPYGPTSRRGGPMGGSWRGFGGPGDPGPGGFGPGGPMDGGGLRPMGPGGPLLPTPQDPRGFGPMLPSGPLLPRPMEPDRVMAMYAGPPNPGYEMRHAMQRGVWTPSNAGSKHIKSGMDINPNLIPNLIGKGGKFVNNLRSEHHVKIKIPERCEDQSYVFISGNKEDVDKVKELINKFLHPTFDGEKKHMCITCEEKFETKSQMRRHIKSAHRSTEPYLCPICNITVKDGYEHKAIHRPTCGFCNKSFGRNTALTRHLKNEHGFVKPKPTHQTFEIPPQPTPIVPQSTPSESS